MDGSMLLPEYDHEFAETRKALERVPDEKFDFQPHDKSFTLGRLASHIAEILQENCQQCHRRWRRS